MEAPTTKVVRIRRKNGEIVQGCDVYVGRRQTQGGWNLEDSIYMNPFSVKKYGLDESLRLYRLHLNKLIISDCSKWIILLKDLHGKSLGCWCKPNKCHGDILKEYADQMKILYDQDLKDGRGTWIRISNFLASLKT